MTGIEPLASCPGLRVGRRGDLLVVVFDGQPTLDGLRVMEQASDRLTATGDKFVSVSVITAVKLEPLSEAVRAETMRLHRKFDAHALCSCTVITSRGVGSIVARTFLAGYQLVMRYHSPNQTFRDVAKAMAWVAKTVPSCRGLDGAPEAIEQFATQATP